MNTEFNDGVVKVVKASAEEWGTFRGFIKRNPLTGFWGGVAFGALGIGPILWRLILP